MFASVVLVARGAGRAICTASLYFQRSSFVKAVGNFCVSRDRGRIMVKRNEHEGVYLVN